MRSDVIAWAGGLPTAKPVSKETLNHAGLIELVSGLNVYQHTAEAYRRAYQALGIDLVNRVPLANAPLPLAPGETRVHPSRPYHFAPLGVYDTAFRQSYPYASEEDLWGLDVNRLDYTDLVTPVPHPLDPADIQARQAALGEVGLYYPMLYTTLFMWPVEVLGWELFMTAAVSQPERFHSEFLVKFAAKSRALVQTIVRASNSPFLFVHDDLASAEGPIFRPAWYDRYLFPHYPEIWAEAKTLGKKIIFVADGDMTRFLGRLVESGVDGLMFETPATPLEAVSEHFGEQGQFLIGGISTRTLTFGSPTEIQRMVEQLCKRAGELPGFAMASGGGLHGSIPLENLEAYFDARARWGFNSRDWRTCARPKGESEGR